MLETTNQVLTKIDLAQVKEAIRSVSLAEYDYYQVGHALMRACDAFLLKDLADYDQALTEVKGIYDGFSFVFDLVLIRGEHCVIADWKTGNVDRPNWDRETKYNDQSSIYLQKGAEWLNAELGIKPTIIQYRGIGYGPEGRTRLVTCRSDELDSHDADCQRDSTLALYGSLERQPVWPRNRPKACFGYNTECPWISDCNRMTMPQGFTSEQYEAGIPRSKSAFKSLLECPERYRREQVLKTEKEGTKNPVIAFGESFHAGVASIWSQCFKLKETK